MTPFRERVQAAWERTRSLLCVGLDPDRASLPARFAGDEDPIFAFNREVIDATHDLVCAYKPQIAFYSAVGAERALEKTIAYIRERAPQVVVILDAKRGDVGNTAAAYALEAFERYGADCVTVNPYLGGDSLRPFLLDPAHGALILCRTSNPGARDLQDLRVDGRPLYQLVAERAAGEWNEHGNVGLVVGATYPEEVAVLRRAHPELPFLVPGIGAQGGDLEGVVTGGLDPRKQGLFISSSRGVVFAGDAGAIRRAAQHLRDQIDALR